MVYGSDWEDFLEESVGQDTPDDVELHVKLERPDPGPDPPKRLLRVGAPLEPGDAVFYDSRTWHWGMKNAKKETRYVIYINFKPNLEHGGVHPEAQGAFKGAVGRENVKFQEHLTHIRSGTSE